MAKSRSRSSEVPRELSSSRMQIGWRLEELYHASGLLRAENLINDCEIFKDRR